MTNLFAVGEAVTVVYRTNAGHPDHAYYKVTGAFWSMDKSGVWLGTQGAALFVPMENVAFIQSGASK